LPGPEEVEGGQGEVILLLALRPLAKVKKVCYEAANYRRIRIQSGGFKRIIQGETPRKMNFNTKQVEE
jgi:hypothetical protein